MRIAKYDLEGNFLQEIECKNIKEASDIFGVDFTGLNSALGGWQHRYGSFQYKEIKGSKRAFRKIGQVWDLIQGVNRGVPIGKYYDGIFICSYDNPSDAALKNDLNVSNLVQNCKGKIKSCGGFVFKYMKD